MRGLLWRCWSECSLIECVDVALFVIVSSFGEKYLNFCSYDISFSTNSQERT